MVGEQFQPGERVVNMQVAGVCTVVSQRDRFVEVETAQGRRITVIESALRRLGTEPVTPKDA